MPNFLDDIKKDFSSNIINNKKPTEVLEIDEDWFYTPIVKEHFFNPQNLLFNDEEIIGDDFDAVGMVGSPACGDMMKIFINVEDDKLKDCKWQTFGCASAIASTSMMSVMVTENDGMTLDTALKIKPKEINDRLGGLPHRKFHCSVLGDKALREAINNYFEKTGQDDRVKRDRVRVIDKKSGTTDHDIEEAVLEGAQTFEDVQRKTKVGVGNMKIQQDVEQLIRHYTEKYFG